MFLSPTQYGIEMIKGVLDFEPDLNKLCPQVIPMSVEEYVKKYWA